MSVGASVDTDLLSEVRAALEGNWREDDWFGCDSKVIFHYAMKATVCRRFAPRRIIEIGTRCGYSLLAFHAATSRASYLCIDGAMDDDSLHCLAHCKRLIERHALDADLIVVDSHAIKSLPPACFAHVDGDHSYEGALADLRLVAGCRAILADDCDNPAVRQAVEQFCRETARTVEFFADGLRQGAVIV
jgi:cephalosporin hydroxylase